MKNFIIVFIITLCFISKTFAQSILNNQMETYPIDKTLEKCSSKYYMTVDMNKCTINGIQSWEYEIKKTSKQIKKTLNSKEKIEKFNIAQQSWENYYNKEKEFLYKTIYEKSGDIHTTFAISHLYEIVKYRAIMLKQYLSEL